MKVKVYFFASMRERTGHEEIELTLDDGAKILQVMEALEERFPAVGEHLRICGVALNEEVCDPGTPLKDRDQLAFLPPFSGGSAISEGER